MVDREGHAIVTMLDGSVRKYVPQRPRLPRHRPTDPPTYRTTDLLIRRIIKSALSRFTMSAGELMISG